MCSVGFIFYIHTGVQLALLCTIYYFNPDNGTFCWRQEAMLTFKRVVMSKYLVCVCILKSPYGNCTTGRYVVSTGSD